MAMIRILLVEDHITVREVIAFVLDRETDLEVVAQATTIAETRQIEEDFDVAIVDLGLPDGEGADLIRELHEEDPTRVILVLSAYTQLIEYAKAVEAGASAFLDKTTPLDEIASFIRRLGSGEELLSSAETVELLRLVNTARTKELAGQQAVLRLSRREKEVLQCLAEGLSDHEIAKRLRISFETERTHIGRIFAKLEVNSRLQALVFAMRYSVVKLPNNFS